MAIGECSVQARRDFNDSYVREASAAGAAAKAAQGSTAKAPYKALPTTKPVDAMDAAKLLGTTPSVPQSAYVPIPPPPTKTT